MGPYTKSEPYTPWIDNLHGEIRMVGILDSDGDEICIVLESQADDLLSHLNRGQ